MTATTTRPPAAPWQEANQRFIVLSLHLLKARLAGNGEDAGDAGRVMLERLRLEMGSPPAVETITATFGLSGFESDLLLLCAGVELDAAFAAVVAEAQGDAARGYPTFSLALGALDQPHWSALAPAGPLRYWRLLEVDRGQSLATSPLRIDERVLHQLVGVPYLDDRLEAYLEPLLVGAGIAGSQQATAERIAGAWLAASAAGTPPVVHLTGNDSAAWTGVAAAACAAAGIDLSVMAVDAVPTAPAELESLLRLWQRETALGGRALLVECDELDAGDAVRRGQLARLVGRLQTPVIVSGRQRLPDLRRTVLAFEVNRPTSTEQRELWRSLLGGATPDAERCADDLAAQFDLGTEQARAAAAEALAGDRPKAADGSLAKNLWAACRAAARPRLDDLAQRIETGAGWDDLILPELQLHTLDDVGRQVRQRLKVYEDWGFAAKSARGLGISALFAGPSGTGKTMAAEVLAQDLDLDLYRIDLSQVVSKYIGETEKNLRRVFDAAENGSAVLLFDEADALFGKRSEVKDSHDRYANIEVSYLLQRMEAYRGLAILTTNNKAAIDPAFMRRIRFVVHFPFPDAAQRARIWERIFPSATPTEGLDSAWLARLNVAGGNIRNIALNAAFLAADAGQPVRMIHLLTAARSEYAKLEKPLPEAELESWVR